MAVEWQDSAIEFATSLAHEVGATVSTRQISSRLLEVWLRPFVEEAAPICLIVAPSEVIVTAASGTRFELPELTRASSEISAIVQSIANGGLIETTSAQQVDFALRMSDGRTMRGVTRRPGQIPPNQRGTRAYGAFLPQGHVE